MSKTPLEPVNSRDRHIVAIGGNLISFAPAMPAYLRYMFSLTGKKEPRVLFINTASGDSADLKSTFCASLVGIPCGDAEFLPLFDRTTDLDNLVPSFDVIFVGGGNVKSMVAVWRTWELDETLRRAWEKGVVLGGSSAGGMCWFNQTCTDSWAIDFLRFQALGFLKESFSPHYNTAGRREAFQKLIATKQIAAGLGVDECAAVHYVGDRLKWALATKPGSAAYAVRLDDNGDVVETMLPMHYLPISR